MFDPLINTPPPTHTHNMTLHTGLMLTRGSSAFVVGSHRRIIITYVVTIWISSNAHSKSNSQWLTPTGSSKQYSASRYIVFAAIHDLDKPISESGIDTMTMTMTMNLFSNLYKLYI